MKSSKLSGRLLLLSCFAFLISNVSYAQKLIENYYPSFGGSVTAFALKGDTAYVGGNFLKVINADSSCNGDGYLSKNGNVLNTFPKNMSPTYAISDRKKGIYICGTLKNIGDSARHTFAHLDSNGQVTSKLRGLKLNGIPRVMCEKNDTLFVSGNFSRCGHDEMLLTNGAPTHAVNGTVSSRNWPRTDEIMSACVSDGKGGWYIGGFFTRVGDLNIPYLAHLNSDGQAYPFLLNPNGPVTGLSRLGDTLFVSGNFTIIDGKNIQNLCAVNLRNNSVINWTPVPGPASTGITVNKLISDTLFIGGNFSSIAGQSRNGLAAFSARTLNILSFSPPSFGVCGFGGFGITDVAAYNGNYFVCGGFCTVNSTSRNGLALFSPSGALQSWNASISGTVSCIEILNNTLYLSGEFTTIGSLSRNKLAAIDIPSATATSWSPTQNGSINKLLVTNSRLYVSGSFTLVNDSLREYTASFNLPAMTLNSWLPNVDGNVSVLESADSTVFVGGTFSSIGGTTRSILMAYDMNTSSILPLQAKITNIPNGSGFIFKLIAHNNQLYMMGSFNQVNGTYRKSLASINIDNGSLQPWHPQTNTGGSVSTLGVVNNNIILTGFFSSINGFNRSSVALVDPLTGNPTPWTVAVSGGVETFAQTGDKLYIGGDFTSVGGSPREKIACVSVSSGSLLPFNTGTNNGAISDFILDGANIYMTGTFTSIAGQPRKVLACVDTSGVLLPWYPGGSENYGPYGHLIPGKNIYHYGSAFIGSSLTRNRLAAFNIKTGKLLSWNPSLSAIPSCIAVADNRVMVGGYFNQVNGQNCKNLCALDPETGALLTSWMPNPDSTVSNLTAGPNNTVYAGGLFKNIFGQSRNYVAQLNMLTPSITAWNPNPNAMVNKTVYAQNRVYIGGNFTNIAASARNYLAAVDTSASAVLISSWNPAYTRQVKNMLLDNGDLYVSAIAISSGADKAALVKINAPTGIIDTNWIVSPNSTVAGLCVGNDHLYISGNFLGFQARNCPGYSSFFLPSGKHSGWYPAGAAASTHVEANWADNKLFLNYTAISKGLLVYETGLGTTVSTVSDTDVCAGEPLSIGFTQKGPMIPLYEAFIQLSDSSGSFQSPITIDTISSLLNKVIAVTIPKNIPGGNAYKIRVLSKQTGAYAYSTHTPVKIKPSPTAIIYVQDTINCANNGAIFFADSSKFSAGAYTRSWRFPGNIFSAKPDTSIVLTPGSSQIVKLTVTSLPGCSDSASKSISVYKNPQAGFTTNNASQCLSSNLFSFQDTSVLHNNLLKKYWYINHSVVDSVNTGIQHSFSVADTHHVKLIIKDAKGCADSVAQQVFTHPQTMVDFTVNDSAQCLAPQHVFSFTNNSAIQHGSFSSAWHFGDSTISSLFNPAKTYTSAGTYTVKLSTISNKGCKDSLLKTVWVHPKTNIGFSINDSSQCFTNNFFTYTNTSSIATGNFTSKWLLDASDTPQTLHAAKAYPQPATYQVILITKTDLECLDTLVKSVTVLPTPLAAFSTDTTQCETGNSFVMNNTSSGSSLTYNWNFGNSNTSSAASPSVSYSTVGNYNIRLVLSDINSCTDTAWQNVRVKASPATPSVLALPDTIACADVNIVLRSTAPATRSWLKNNSPLGVSADSLVISNSPGAYSLKVTNADNCDAISGVLNISFKPVPPQPVLSIAGNVLSSSASTGNQWYNGAGIISGQTGQTFTASAPGNYYSIVTLNGCSSLPSASQSFPATGIKTMGGIEISLFPNPSNGNFTIRFSQPPTSPITMLLTDLSGKEIMRKTLEMAAETEIRTGDIANGTYLLMLQNDHNSWHKKVIVNK